MHQCRKKGSERERGDEGGPPGRRAAVRELQLEAEGQGQGGAAAGPSAPGFQLWRSETSREAPGQRACSLWNEHGNESVTHQSRVPGARTDQEELHKLRRKYRKEQEYFDDLAHRLRVEPLPSRCELNDAVITSLVEELLDDESINIMLVSRAQWV